MSKNYKLYVHINKANGKRYYGITSQEVSRRWRNGNGYKPIKNKDGELKCNEHFWNSICKYGWNEGFEHIVLFDNLTKEEAELIEKCYIALYDTTNQDKGYNISKGGESSNGTKHTEEWKQEQSKRMSGEGNSRARKIALLNTREIFNTIGEGVEKYKKYKSNATNIGICCNKGKFKSSGILNGKKLVWRFYEDYIKMTEEEIKQAIEEAQISYTEETKEKMSKARQGKKHPNSQLFKVINDKDEVIGIYCLNEICNHHTEGFLDISIPSFNKYIKPFKNINIDRIQGKHPSNVRIRKKLKYYNGWKFIEINKNETKVA